MVTPTSAQVDPEVLVACQMAEWEAKVVPAEIPTSAQVDLEDPEVCPVVKLVQVATPTSDQVALEACHRVECPKEETLTCAQAVQAVQAATLAICSETLWEDKQSEVTRDRERQAAATDVILFVLSAKR